MTAQDLKNSILQMAVQGKLVPQDPNDEPASVLLQRIQAEKEKLIKAGKLKREKNPSVIFRGSDNLPYEKVGKDIRCIADEIPFEIPDSWEWVRLNAIVFNHGQKVPDKDFCYIDIGSIDNQKNALNPCENIISATKAPCRARKITSCGDILYATVRPYLHNMCIIDRSFSKECIASTGFAVLSCFGGIENKFLFRFLMSPDFDAYANSSEISKGIAYPAINDKKLYKALIPVPPLAEQKRIVAKIEELLPHLNDYDRAETLVKNLNTEFPEQLKKSILQWAIQGKLVPQNPDDEPASELLERIRAEKAKLVKAGKLKKDKDESFIYRRDNSHYEKLNGKERCIDDEIPFEIPKTWRWVRLKNIVSVLGDGIHGTPEYNARGPVYFINGSNLQNGKIIVKSDTKMVSSAEAEKHKKPLGDRSILISINGTIGNIAFYDNELIILGKSACYFNLMDNIEKNYMKFVMETEYFLKYAIQRATGSTIKNVSLYVMNNFLLPIPPVAEQKRIVAELEKVFAVQKTMRMA